MVEFGQFAGAIGVFARRELLDGGLGCDSSEGVGVDEDVGCGRPVGSIAQGHKPVSQGFDIVFDVVGVVGPCSWPMKAFVGVDSSAGPCRKIGHPSFLSVPSAAHASDDKAGVGLRG